MGWRTVSLCRHATPYRQRQNKRKETTMEKYIKPSMEIVKVEVREALLLNSLDVISTDQNDVDLAPRRKDLGSDFGVFNVWERWSDGTEDDGYAVQVEANK